MGTGYLVDVAEVGKQLQRFSCQPKGQRIGVNAFWIEILEGRKVVGHEAVAVLVHHEVFRQRLQRVGGEISDASLLRQQIAAHQMVKLGLVDHLLRARGNHTARPHIVKVVQVLSRVALQLVGHGEERISRLPLQSHVVVIGGGDDGELALGVD